MNLLIQTRGLHTLTVRILGFLECREAGKAGKVEKMGNLQGTALHRGHRREGAGLLRKRGVRGNVFCDREAGIGMMMKGTKSIETTKENNSER